MREQLQATLPKRLALIRLVHQRLFPWSFWLLMAGLTILPAIEGEAESGSLRLEATWQWFWNLWIKVTLWMLQATFVAELWRLHSKGSNQRHNDSPLEQIGRAHV